MCNPDLVPTQTRSGCGEHCSEHLSHHNQDTCLCYQELQPFEQKPNWMVLLYRNDIFCRIN